MKAKVNGRGFESPQGKEKPYDVDYFVFAVISMTMPNYLAWLLGFLTFRSTAALTQHQSNCETSNANHLDIQFPYIIILQESVFIISS